jgi:quercetin dioxygenase-like cupin family protein
MKIIKVNELESIKNPHGVNVKKLYDTDYAQVMYVTLMPGEALKPHTTPVDVFFYVLSGKGDVEIGNERETVTANCLVDSPANIQHCLYNYSDEIFKVLVVKVPNPAKKKNLD